MFKRSQLWVRRYNLAILFWYRKVYSRYTTCENCIRLLPKAIFLFAGLLVITLTANADDYIIYSDAGRPLNSEIYTWHGAEATFDDQYSDPTAVEGVKSFLTSCSSWAGWGIAYTDDYHDLRDYSEGYLKFWVKTNSNLKIELKDQMDKSEKYISAYGWDGTNRWQEISIPLAAFGRDLAVLEYPFMVTREASDGEFYIDYVRWTDPRWDKIRTEANYILACQYMGTHPAYGAINNIYGNPTWVVPRENALAILGLMMASEATKDDVYLKRAELAADYLVRVQDPIDGAWCDQYNYAAVVNSAKSPTQTAEVMIALYKLGYLAERYNAMKKGAQFLMSCQQVENKQGNDDGLLGGGKDETGNYRRWRWASDNAYAYQALKAACGWAIICGEDVFAEECRRAAGDIIEGINHYLYHPPIWHIAIDADGTALGNPDLPALYNNLPSWINYAPQMLDLPAQGVNTQEVGEWIHTNLQQDDGSCVGYVAEGANLITRRYPGLSFQAALCWSDLGQDAYGQQAWDWAKNSGLWQTSPDDNRVTGGWIDWEEIEPEPDRTADWWLRFIDTSFYAIATLCGGYDFNIFSPTEQQEKLYHTGLPYIKYFQERALDTSPSVDGYIFAGLTRSFQLDLGPPPWGYPDPLESVEAIINYAASAYDHSILGRISLAGGMVTILDTYVDYFHHLDDENNPLINCNGDYHGPDPLQPILYGPYRIVRIGARDEPLWWENWDWILDTGACATLILYALEAYQHFPNEDYRQLAVVFADYILRLQDIDGGIRYGPIGMYHPDTPVTLDFYWHLKSTEQNEQVLYALEALFTVTAEPRYNQACAGIKGWLQDMYDHTVHLFHSAAVFNVDEQRWQKRGFDYVATDVMAFAPLEMMSQDPYFGSTQEERDAEVEAMFQAIEARTAFLENEKPVLFKFSVSQEGPDGNNDFGSVEMSAQMALAYLRAAQIYAARGQEDVKVQQYLSKYNTLVASLEDYFFTPEPLNEPEVRLAPYASYYPQGTVAGGVFTGTGYYTFNCQAALASAYYAFAKAGYDPTKLGGGAGIPPTAYTLNLSVPWYQNSGPYFSSGAAVAQMVLNYIREGAGVSLLDQETIYTYAKQPGPFVDELNPTEMDLVLGHFDPYDNLVSNWADRYDNYPDGNPYQGYNFTVDTYDANSAGALNEYMRDICHWMAYTVTEEDWWRDGDLVAHPNTPAAVPLYGTAEHWAVVKGYATSAHPCPQPHTDPYSTPDFTVYGFWIKDPLTDGLGKDTYKTAAECASTYFLPLSGADVYDGMFVQVAEPPAEMSDATVNIPEPEQNQANLEFVGVKTQLGSDNNLKTLGLNLDLATVNKAALPKQDWRDIVDAHLLSDTEATRAFDGTEMGEPVLVKRPDQEEANYYLVPFGKRNSRRRLLVLGVLILDANKGYFKEASWTESPQKLLKVDRQQAIRLVRRYISKAFVNELRKLPKSPGHKYLVQKLRLSRKYTKVLQGLGTAKAELLWQPGSYSSSPYKPYWKIETNGYIWYVTQEGRLY